MFQWATDKNWTMRHSKGPTFQTKNHGSNIDFFATKGISTSVPKSAEDIWTGNTQHNPVAVRFKVSQGDFEGRRRRRISAKNWKDEEKQKRISSWYKERVPDLIDKIKQCNNPKQLQTIYRQLLKTGVNSVENEEKHTHQRQVILDLRTGQKCNQTEGTVQEGTCNKGDRCLG